jgi:type IV secretory pathway VirD2 relaxase
MWLCGQGFFVLPPRAPSDSMGLYSRLCAPGVSDTLSIGLMMSQDDDNFRVRPGRSSDRGAGSGRKAKSLAAQVKRAAGRSGYTRSLARSSGRKSGRRGQGARGRGRNAMLRIHRPANARRVVVMARVVRHQGARFRAAPLGRHLSYLKRDGVTKDGRDASLFDARSDRADGDAFAERCADDRHHFRFIVSPEDASQMDDLHAFTRELMADMARDLDTELDWVAVDHWNTDNPHIHVLVRGRADDGSDLVIDRDYIREGVRARAEERVTLELGPRSERDIRAALEREVEADRWTSLDQRLRDRTDEVAGTVDLRPGGADDDDTRRLLCGRADKLERLGLAEETAPGIWRIRAGAEQTLRDLAIRTDIIKTMHRAMSDSGRAPDLDAFALHDAAPNGSIVGRLVDRGLHDELAGSAYAVIDGADGRAHHIRFDDLDMTGDARPGAIVEVRRWQDGKGKDRLSLATRSDLPLREQITAPGATWLDRQLIAREPVATGNGFGIEIRDAMEARSRELESAGLARRQGNGFRFERDLIETLRAREMAHETDAIAARTGLAHRPSAEGDYVNGVYRQRVTLASGRFAMIDDGLGFQLVPWRPALDQHLGQHISGTMGRGGSVDWALGRGRGLGL